MKTFRLLAFVLSVCFISACTSRTAGDATESDSTVAPGVGAAPDNSREASDSTLLPNDTTTLKNQ